jgi:hypothetical protein
MGGRLTDFNQVDMLTLTGGRVRPVDGPKESAVPIGSHLPDDRPVVRQMNVQVGARGVEFTVDWAVRNESAHALSADYRIRLERRRGGNDETWFEYRPENKQVKSDIVWDKTGNRHKILTKHGGSKTTQAKPVRIAPAGTTTMRIGFTIPGTGVSSQMKKFWQDRSHSTFNLLVAVYQITSQGPKKLDEHEFDDVLDLTVPKGAPAPTPKYTGTFVSPYVRALPTPTRTRTAWDDDVRAEDYGE